LIARDLLTESGSVFVQISDENVHLAGTVSEPFEAGENRRVSVKVIDDRGNELMVVKNLYEDEGKK